MRAAQLRCPHKQHGCWHTAQTAFQTAHTWLIDQLLRNRAGDGLHQTEPSTLCDGGTYFVWLREDDCWSANRLSAQRHYDLPSVHFPASAPIPPPPPHQPQTTMSWLMISFPLGRQIYPFHFLPHSGHLSNQTGLPLGKGTQGQDWVTHSGWVNVGRGTFRGEKSSPLSIYIKYHHNQIAKLVGGEKVHACIQRKKRSSDIGGPGFCHLV